MKDKIIPVVSVLIGVLAFILTSQYLRGKHAELEKLRQELYAGARKIYVVAAAHDIPSGSVIKREDLGKLEIFETQAPDKIILVEDANLILGARTSFAVKSEKPLLWSDIEGGTPTGLLLAPAVMPGMRAISLAVGGANAVSGMVDPNDRVDVLGTFPLPSRQSPGEIETVTLTMLQDVTVLAVGQTLAKQLAESRGGRRPSYSTVTLEVTPREAELLVFAQQAKGQLTLALRNPADVSFEKDLPEINFTHLEAELPELNLFRQRNIRHKKDL
ncbi:MAG: Flp pilus assembly protein CpaB [Lentisphaerae bacterium]|nr:Flp pilus assembly protein CpaB [Lentisphaerota bacterium]